jgi:hypothetical protein
MARKPDPEIDPVLYFEEAVDAMDALLPRDACARSVIREVLRTLGNACFDNAPLRQSDLDTLHSVFNKTVDMMEK